ncbi:hypothetical protein OG21DRAFT_1506065 [Imleria badia]|nr:hypothetical protein OG21DRAFT_1506065 [Imleria badia]
MVETLGEEALKSEVTAVWDPGMFLQGHSGLMCIEYWMQDLVQRYLAAFERNGDAALRSDNAEEAVVRYSTDGCK